jgi:hypothetical protein
MASLTVQENFALLREELRTAGCLDYKPWRSVASLLLHLVLSGAAFFIAARLPFFAAAALFTLGSFFFYRIGWLMHDAAHNGVFATAEHNQKFAALTAGVLGEFPSGVAAHPQQTSWIAERIGTRHGPVRALGFDAPLLNLDRCLHRYSLLH